MAANRGHGPGRPVEKAKDFKGTVGRLFSELKGFKNLIAISLILAALGSILSIFAPNKLSDLTDLISEGLVVNTENIEVITNEVTKVLNKETLKEKLPEILNLDMSTEIVQKILTSKDVTDEEKLEFQIKSFIYVRSNYLTV